MKLTLQSDGLLQFRRLASTLLAGPRGFSLHVIDYREKLALALGGSDWLLLMPVRGRRPQKTFRIPFKPVHELPNAANGKVFVEIHHEKGFGKLQWREPDGWTDSASFPFGPADYTACRLPSEPTESHTFSTSLLADLEKCNRICAKSWPYPLGNIRLTPGGELGASDGKRLLLLETEHRFPWQENLLVRTCGLYRLPELRKKGTFALGTADGWVRFGFGDVLFYTRPDVERFPELRRVLPKDEGVRTRLTLDPRDAAFLKKHLTGPKKTEITLFCNYGGTVSVCRPNSPSLIPAYSNYRGDAMVLTTEQGHFLEALALGCLDFQFGEPYPAAFGPNGAFCWVPTEMSFLPLDSEFPPKPDAVLRSSD